MIIKVDKCLTLYRQNFIKVLKCEIFVSYYFISSFPLIGHQVRTETITRKLIRIKTPKRCLVAKIQLSDREYFILFIICK
jgi:hypothetical protein